MTAFFSKANWGSGDSFLDFQLKAPGFENCLVAIGLSIVGSEKKIADGELDQQIIDLGNWMKSLDKRPIFLRIGYEFDGYDWNHYNKEYYLKAWHHIVDKFRMMGVNNVAYVWQSKGFATTMDEMVSWYPGDDYVDWCGFSFFSNPDNEMIKFGKKHGKPVFICESTPVLQQGNSNVYDDADIKKPEIAIKLWNQWYSDFFKTIEDNQDVVKAFSYINTNWPSEVMWLNNNTFNQVDSRIQMSDYVSTNWKAELAKDKYLKPNNTLFNKLWNK